MNKYKYDTDVFPAMPVLQVWLGYPGEALSLGPIDAIVDTGADGCLIPQLLLDAVRAPLVDQVRVRSHWGEARLVNLYTIDLAIGDVKLPAVEAAGDAGQEIILGRNVLNRLCVLLDGPSQMVEVK